MRVAHIEVLWQIPVTAPVGSMQMCCVERHHPRTTQKRRTLRVFRPTGLIL